jgi:lipopolysaccharide/colanic/teichoic acid biosynthesis glycosyltransferase
MWVRPRPRARQRENSVESGLFSATLAGDILSEKGFLYFLRLERKRSERSERPFALLLLDVREILADPALQCVFERVLLSVSKCTRETDLKGWYEDQALFGIIFADLCLSDREQVLQTLLLRVSKAVREHLTSDQVDNLRMALHIYPESPVGSDGDEPPNFALYKDLLKDVRREKIYRAAKRGMDIVGSLLGILLLAPVLVAIAIAIKLTSKGPVLFRQERVGRYFKKFTFLKFRSMRTGNDPSLHRKYVEELITAGPVKNGAGTSGGAVYKIRQDPRVTWIGSFLRRTSLDELPQLINVLRGEMALVGPRPCIPYEFRCYRMWHRSRLLLVKPGITGLWQVNGRSRVTFDEMVRLDLEYAKSRSLLLDLKILFQTPRAVLSGAGAY